MAERDGFEATLRAVEDEADSALRASAVLAKELKKAKAAAVGGQVRDLRRALEAAEAFAEQLADAARSARQAYDFDDTSYLSSGSYAKELLVEAEAQDLAMFEEDERLLCYPSLIRILPGEAAIEVDRQKERRLRPSVVVANLKARQAQAPRFKPEPFLDALLGGYELVVAREGKRFDAVVRLVDVWAVLTMLPGTARDYTKQEFARDLYLLDQKGVNRSARRGRVLHWAASTGTKAGTGVLTTVARSGQQQRYWGISFS